MDRGNDHHGRKAVMQNPKCARQLSPNADQKRPWHRPTWPEGLHKSLHIFYLSENRSLLSEAYGSLVPLKMLRLLEVTRQSVFIIAHRYNYFEYFRRLFWLDAPNYVKIEVGRG